MCNLFEKETLVMMMNVHEHQESHKKSFPKKQRYQKKKKKDTKNKTITFRWLNDKRCLMNVFRFDVVI